MLARVHSGSRNRAHLLGVHVSKEASTAILLDVSELEAGRAAGVGGSVGRVETSDERTLSATGRTTEFGTAGGLADLFWVREGDTGRTGGAFGCLVDVGGCLV